MPSEWAAVDRLMRELGEVRNDARVLDAAGAGDGMVEIDRLIAAAAQAVDDTIAGPDSEPLLMGACAAIVSAHHRIAALTAARAVPEHPATARVPRRWPSARRLFEAIRSGSDQARR